jgi:hypothetical protein
MSNNKMIMLPREVVEQALEAWARGCPPDCKDGMTDSGGVHPWGEAALIKCPSCQAVEALSAALKHPDTGNPATAPEGWKLVPVEPTAKMVDAARSQSSFPAGVWRAMLAAAPKPPTTKESSVVQPQANQPAMMPIAQRKLDSLLAEGYTIIGYSVYHERKHQHGFVTGAGLVGWWKPDGVEYPQPLGEQETDWSDSKTLPSELWKNPLLSLQERLQIADGAVQWNREVAENLRARLRAAQQPQGEQEPLAWIREEWSSRTLNFDGPPTVPSVRDELTKPVWTPLYTHPQPKREPLTDNQIDKIAESMPGGLEGFLKGWGWRQFARAVLENDHNIK